MSLTKEEVLKIAKLSKLSFEEAEIEKFQVELNDILKYIDMLNEVDTSEVQPLVHINDVVNNFREKEEKASIERINKNKIKKCTWSGVWKYSVISFLNTHPKTK